MVINSSRWQTAASCWRKVFNYHHRRLKGATSMPLVDGAGFHEGMAHGLASKDWELAERKAVEKFDEAVKSSNLLPEEFFIIEEHRNLVRKMLACYRDNFESEQYEILQPECEFEVALPDSHHSCVFLHWFDRADWSEHWGEPPADLILAGRVASHQEAAGVLHSPNHPHNCACYQPHRVKGKTDALVLWNFGGSRGLWLFEHKTTSISGNQFWNQWFLDNQPTIYIYGIWKALGLLPSGFILNSIVKPSEAQINNWNSRRKYGPPKKVEDYITYERQAFLRTKEDLLRVEEQLRDCCNEWESRITTGKFPLSNTRSICHQYNRSCDYHQMCISHDQPSEMEALAFREKDYIDIRLEELKPTL
jgi:hypothetical protein